ncbi:MAG TPA: hypothetical protein VGS80_05270, partial [Ktedonobacterales bacterium]|nr:hypothetical protein [Ktedonobacterales bacterium]
MQRVPTFQLAQYLALLLLIAASGCATSATCPSNAVGTGPPTISDGPVTVDTDHSIYAPDAPMQLTFTDHLSAA